MKNSINILPKSFPWIAVLLIGSLFPVMEGGAQKVSNDTIPSGLSPVARIQSLIPGKTDFGLQTGTSFFTSSYGSGFRTFVSPHMSYGISKKFRLNGGISIVNTSLTGYSIYSTEEIKYPLNGNFTNALISLSGKYALSNRMTVTGTAYKQFNLFGDIPGMKVSDFNNVQGLYMNIQYKIRDNFHIDAGFGYSKGNNPFYSPYNNLFDLTPAAPFYHQIP